MFRFRRSPSRSPATGRPRCVCEPLEPRRLLSGDALLPVETLAALPDLGATPTQVTHFTPASGGVSYFLFESGGYGGFSASSIWRTDGTAAGTFRVAPDDRLQHGVYDSTPRDVQIVPAGGRTFFVASDEGSGSELYAADDATGAVSLVKDIRPGGDGSRIEEMGAVGTTLYFSADDGVHGQELWRSDGTASGTRLVADLDPGRADFNGEPIGSSPADFAAVGGEAYFTAALNGRRRLWRTDGTADGTRVFTSQTSYPLETGVATAVVGGKEYLSGPGGELIVTDGTEGGTRDLLDRRPVDSASYAVSSLTPVGKRMFFLADDGVHGQEAWASDGTVRSTVMLADIAPGPANGAFRVLASDDRYVYFKQYDAQGETIAEENAVVSGIWRTDGTVKGTRKLDFGVPTKIFSLAAIDGKLYFGADGMAGAIPGGYRTDGTPGGTERVIESSSIPIGVAGGRPIVVAYADPTFKTSTQILLSALGRPGDKPSPTPAPAPAPAPPPPAAGAVSGVVYSDLNADGQAQRGEPGIAGVRVFVDLDRDGLKGRHEPFARTDADGVYVIRDVPAGKYRIAQTGFGAEWSLTTPASVAVRVPAGRSGVAHFGNHREVRPLPPVVVPTGIVSGVVFEDANADGVMQVGERVLAGHRVWLDLNGDGNLDRREPFARTDANGLYVIPNVPAGRYLVSHTGLGGDWRETTPAAVRTVVRPGLTGVAHFGTYEATADASVSGRVFADADRNGRFDPGEGGLGGFRLYLDENDNGVFDRGETGVRTGADGRFRLSGLAAGRHVLRQTLVGFPYSPTTATRVELDLTAGESRDDLLFGNATL